MEVKINIKDNNFYIQTIMYNYMLLSCLHY